MIRALALVFISASLAFAQPAPTISAFVASTGSTNVSNSSTTYFTFNGIAGTFADLTNDGGGNSPLVFVTNSSVLSATFNHLCCFLGAAPGGGKSYTITPVSNPTGWATTVTIADTATSACDGTNSHSTAGDGQSNVGYKVVPSGSPTATTVGCYIEATVN